VDSNLHDQNRIGDIENKENDTACSRGGAKCAPLENKTEQVAQLLQALEALTPDERNALLQALGGGVNLYRFEAKTDGVSHVYACPNWKPFTPVTK